MIKLLCVKIVALLAVVCSAVVMVESAVDTGLSADRYYRLDDRIEVLILGHSQTESALDDRRLSHAVNFSQSAEHYLYSYHKLVKLTEANSTIKTVLLSVSDNMFSDRANNRWLYEKNTVGYKYPKYSHLLDFQEKLLFVRNDVSSFKDVYFSALQKNIYMFFSGKYKLHEQYKWGGYVSSSRDCLQQDIFNSRENARPEPLWTRRAAVKSNVEYVRKIVSYCEGNGIKLILLRTPHHVCSRRPFEQELKGLLRKELSGVPFWDYSDYPLRDDCYQDLVHLNHTGAEFFSGVIEKRLRQMQEHAVPSVVRSSRQAG